MTPPTRIMSTAAAGIKGQIAEQDHGLLSQSAEPSPTLKPGSMFTFYGAEEGR